jgi:hypothetical protein
VVIFLVLRSKDIHNYAFCRYSSGRSKINRNKEQKVAGRNILRQGLGNINP